MKKLILLLLIITTPAVFGQVFEEQNGKVFLVNYDTLNKYRIGVVSRTSFTSMGSTISNDFLSSEGTWPNAIKITGEDGFGGFGYSWGLSLEYWFAEEYSLGIEGGVYSVSGSFDSRWYTTSILPDGATFPINISQRNLLDVTMEGYYFAPEFFWITPVRFLVNGKKEPIRLSVATGIYFPSCVKYDYQNEFESGADYPEGLKKTSSCSNYFKSSMYFEPKIKMSFDLEAGDNWNIVPNVAFAFGSAEPLEHLAWDYSQFSVGVDIQFGFGDRIEKDFVKELPTCDPGYQRNMITGNCEPVPCDLGYRMNFTTGDCEEIPCPPGYQMNFKTGICEEVPCEPGFAMNFETGECEPLPCPLGWKMNYETGECEEVICGKGFRKNPVTGECDPIVCSEGYSYSDALDTCVRELPTFNRNCSGPVLMFASRNVKTDAEKQLQYFIAKGLVGFGIVEGEDQISGDLKYRVVSGCFENDVDAFIARDYLLQELGPKLGIDFKDGIEVTEF
jgi:hypothetical protein